MLRHARYGAAVPDELVQYRDPAIRPHLVWSLSIPLSSDAT
jgi:hypothetical protein